MEDSHCPKFLDGHVKKLREAWEDTSDRAKVRRKALEDNNSSWEIYGDQKMDTHRHLDQADTEYENIKKIFDLDAGPRDYNMRLKNARILNKTIQDNFKTVSDANDCLQQMLPEDKKSIMNNEVQELKTRMDIIEKTESRLNFIDDFNKRLSVWDKNVGELEVWLKDGKKRLGLLQNPVEIISTEDRVTKAMEVQEDINKKSDFCRKQEVEKEEIFPKPGEKLTADAKRFIERLKTLRNELNDLDSQTKEECLKFSEDVKYYAEFQTGVKVFEPWMKKAELRITTGIPQPKALVEACTILGDSKNFQEECEEKLKILDEAAVSANKMTMHKGVDIHITKLKE